MNNIMKVLNLIRHGKASYDTSMDNDFRRPLNEKGESNSNFLNEHLARYNLGKHKILCSAALRTRGTLNCLEDSLNRDSKIIYTNDLYLANSKEIIRQLSLEKDLRMVTIVGHNPGLSDLLVFLSGRFGLRDMPTSSIAQLEFTEKRKKILSEASAKINFFIQSKDRTIINLLEKS